MTSSSDSFVHISPFTPEERAARERLRRDGMTPARKRRFLESLAGTGSVGEAARQAGVSRQAFYMLRARGDDADFNEAWDMAMAGATQMLADVAYERAIDGVEEPVFYRGELVATRRRYNDKLLMHMLRVRDPSRFAPLSDLRGFDRSIQTTEVAEGSDFDAVLARISDHAAEPVLDPERGWAGVDGMPFFNGPIA